jgi:hypothetical protein
VISRMLAAFRSSSIHEWNSSREPETSITAIEWNDLSDSKELV